jgi:predicted  nucleic acid-binding Zn-ribbon protein
MSDQEMDARFDKLAASIKSDISVLRSEMAEFKRELRAELSEFKSEIRAEMSGVKSDVSTLKTDVSTLKSDVSTVRSEIKAEGEITRRHFDVVGEGLRAEIKVIADGHFALRDDLAGLKAAQERLEGNLEEGQYALVTEVRLMAARLPA